MFGWLLKKRNQKKWKMEFKTTEGETIELGSFIGSEQEARKVAYQRHVSAILRSPRILAGNILVKPD